MIENTENFTLENCLNNSYPEIIKSIKNEKYILDYDNFDLFYEIKHDGEVVGFIALENSTDCLIINECYVMENFRGGNLFYKNYLDIINSSEKEVFIRKPNKNLINVLLNNNLAYKMENDIVISYVDFIVDLKDTFKNSKIKHYYKKIKDNTSFIANIFDLNLSATLFFDDMRVFSKKNNVICICEARKYDLKRYSIRKKLKKIQSKYLDETFNIISDNLTDIYDYFKNFDENFSNSNKRLNKFLNENSEFEDKNLDIISPTNDFTFNCPFCDEITQKSVIHCHSCGFNLEKTLMRNENKVEIVENYDNDVEYDDFKEDNEISEGINDFKNNIKSEEEFKNAFLKVLRATGDLSLSSKELEKKPLKSLNIIDYDYLKLDREKYDSKEDEKLNVEKSVYAMLKYTNEHPTPWNIHYDLESIENYYFDYLIERGYITKVMPDEFPELFKDCTVEELKRESDLQHDPDTTKEDMINYFMKTCDRSWIVSEKGFEYLKAHPFLDFFTNNLLEFNIFEFKLFKEKYENELTLEEIGDKYINAKLTKALEDNELDLYLNYVDYYFNLNLSKNNYETAFIYLIQRIIYELNIWLLKDYYVAFDEAFSMRTDNLLFEITKLNCDFDLKILYDRAFNSLKIDEIKFGYDETYEILKRIMDGDHVFEINSELLEAADKEGKFKSFKDDLPF